MDLFSVLSLIGGLAFFLFGMNLMSASLEKMAGGKLEVLLKKMTSNPVVSMFLGATITMVIQSSSATTVMLVGLVNSGIMQFAQTVYVCFGANIGTTMTGWLVSLSGIESSNLFLQMLKPINFSPILALIGIILIMFSKKERKHSIGTVFLGFAILMYGMTMMTDAVAPLADMPAFAQILASLQNPILGLLFGFVFTMIVQSSSASLAILQALSMTGTLSVGMVVPMVMGLNIGTCTTGMISSIGTNTNAKRVAFSHFLFNILATLILLPLFLIGQWVFALDIVKEAVSPFSVALIHTIFNILLTVLLMPFTKQLVKLVELLVRDRKKKEKKEDDGFCMLDERLLQSPSVAIAECNNLTVQMSALAYNTLVGSISILFDYDEERAARVLRQEDQLDLMEDRLGTYLVKISSQSLSTADSRSVSRMLHTIGDFERLGDHAVNLLKVSKEIHDKSIVFSAPAQKELKVLTEAALDILTLTTNAFRENNSESSQQVEPFEQVIDRLIQKIKSNHIDRLQNGNCTIELGFVLSDLLTNFERISDHCSNIAVAIIEVAQGSFDTHRYLNQVKSGNDEFELAYRSYSEKYVL